MKTAPLFISQDNKLIRIADSEPIDTEKLNNIPLASACDGSATVPAGKNTLTAITVPWNSVDFGNGSYNEETLAGLRGYLKKLELTGRTAFIIPEAGRTMDDADTADSFIKAMVHTARRIKDCSSVAGFAIPSAFIEKDEGLSIEPESFSGWFMSEMNVKHSHYVYFADSAEVSRFHLGAAVSKTPLVLYKM